MRINTNIAALTSNNALNRTYGRADNSMRRLSTGLRITSASDDASGMAISNKLRGQVNGLTMASRNSLDGISLVQTAEGALAEVQNMIQRMRELAIQAANDTLQAEDRAAIQREIDQLITEINDTALKTEFNTIRLLNGDSDRATSSSNSSVASMSFISHTFNPGTITYNLVKPGLPATITSSGPTDGYGLISLMNSPNAPSLAGTLTINGETIEITENDTPTTIANRLRELAGIVGIDIHVTPLIGGNIPPNPTPPSATWDQWLNGDATLLFATQSAGSNQQISISSSNSNLLQALGLTNTAQNPPRGTDAVVENVVYNGVPALASANGNEISITAGAGQNIRINIHTQINLDVPGGAFQLGDGEINILNLKYLDLARGNLPIEQLLTAVADAYAARLASIQVVNSLIAPINVNNFPDAVLAIDNHISVTEGLVIDSQNDVAQAQQEVNIRQNYVNDRQLDVIRQQITVSQYQVRLTVARGILDQREIELGNAEDALEDALYDYPDLQNDDPDRYDSLREAVEYAEEAVEYAEEAVEYAISDLEREQDLLTNVVQPQLANAQGELETAQSNHRNAQDIYKERKDDLDAARDAQLELILAGEELERARAALENANVPPAMLAAIGSIADNNSDFLGSLNTVLASIAGNLSAEPDESYLPLRLDILDSGPLILHVGANQSTTLDIQLPAVNARSLGLENINMRSRQGADRAITQMDEALSRVSEIRSRLGSFQNRLETTIANLNVNHENSTGSLSLIKDVDMAREMSIFTQLNVLAQAGVSILSQANQSPQQMLSLLQ